VERNHQHEPSPTLERLSRARAAVVSDEGANPIVPPDRPDEAVLRYVRELAKRLAREDHEAEIAAGLASNRAVIKSR
jgi:hypothetical protein